MIDTQCTIAKPKAPLTAFMLFCNDERPKLMAKTLDDESPKDNNETFNGQKRKLQLGELQKLLGEAWKMLDESERQVYADKARIMKEEYNKNMQKWLDSVGSNNKRIFDNQVLAFPSFRLQKLMKADKSAHKVSSGALNIINKATVMFLQMLVNLSNNCRSNRKTGRSALIKDDVVTAIRRGGIRFKFLQSCSYILDDDDEVEANESVEKNDETNGVESTCVELVDASCATKSRKQYSKLKNNEKKNKVKSADITTFFKRM